MLEGKSLLRYFYQLLGEVPLFPFSRVMTLWVRWPQKGEWSNCEWPQFLPSHIMTIKSHLTGSDTFLLNNLRIAKSSNVMERLLQEATLSFHYQIAMEPTSISNC